MTTLRRDGDNLLLSHDVQPRPRHNMFGEVRSGEVIVKLIARPVAIEPTRFAAAAIG